MPRLLELILKKAPLLLFFISCQVFAVLTYVNNVSCLQCHEKQTKSWQKSDHYHSMMKVTDKNVLADFNNSQLKSGGVTYTFFSTKKNYYIKVKDNNEKTQIHRVIYTFGYKPLQQYLVQFPEGKLQAFPIAWDVEKKRWFNLLSNKEDEPKSPLHWTKRFYNWNHACADCHSTDFRKNFNGKSYDSQFAGINVNCQACHGPGSGHLVWAKKAKPSKDKGLVINFKKMTAKQKVDQCAHCHSRRSQVVKGYDITKPFEHQYIPSLLSPNIYHRDGQIKDEVFVYGSFVQSKMYQAGVQCMDCHNPHSLKLRYSGNKLCTQCHNDNLAKRFNGLKIKDYDLPKHTHHPIGSIGSQCVSCHMPATTYMKVDPRRDHSFKIPSPSLTESHGIPNACNHCHKEKSAKWASKKIIQWFGKSTKPLVLTSNNDELIKIIEDKSSPEMFKASAVMLLQINSHQILKTLAKALSNESDKVVLAALNKVSSMMPNPLIESVLPLLSHENPIIRATAANILSSNKDLWAKQQYKAAMAEYLKIQKAHSDQPESHMNLAQLALRQGQVEHAIVSYKKAIALDKHAVVAYQNLARVYQSKGDIKASIAILKQAIKANPSQAGLYYDLGLAYAQDKQLPLAEESLQKVLKIDPDYPRAVYNLSLIVYQRGKPNEALELLKKAIEKNPNDRDLINNAIYIQNQTR